MEVKREIEGMEGHTWDKRRRRRRRKNMGEQKQNKSYV